ncbi:XdhC family protein [Neobacillus notoginsengisoli]|uniref:XdhC family protein n=1 Tax=Neobacillus notoginsengisoli TaxID=1578198 RepID=A0A417YW09_9BACI|nr:XdhC family protein [Neobacillus notoginsengisoli]RHW41580.1 XdhC family protein [Neobacillus notoginsengisoli]
MKSLDIFNHLLGIKLAGKNAALATIIRTKGSTPRKAGSKMLIMEDGNLIGTIGGGCGEAEVIETAMVVISSQKPAQHQVDLTKGLFYEDGGICGGIMDVFIEPV